MGTLLPTLLLALAGCQDTAEEFPYEQFNADDQELTVCVGSASGCAPVTDLALLSTNGSTEVGSATVDPGEGPVGTIHRFEVTVDADWIDTVTLVQVAMGGDRGDQTYDLRQDSADHGNWVVEVQSLGEPDEQRTDTATILLWEDSPDDAAETSTEGT